MNLNPSRLGKNNFDLFATGAVAVTVFMLV
jgi:hypothetical protein